MKKLVVGILAHVDAGKTTLSEGLLYRGGALRKLGRVDHGDAFLDTDALERERGITIFSKQALIPLETLELQLVDTPGHVDFSAGMERTLQVLDYAILVISGTDGVQSHTRTLWRLLARYQVPTFLFVNKMDLAGADRTVLLTSLRKELSDGCVDFSAAADDAFFESVAMCGEKALSQYLDTGCVSDDEIAGLISCRELFPCWFGSALKLEGVDAFLKGMERYARCPAYPADFAAKVYQIRRDAQGSRLTLLKVTGGTLRVRDRISDRRFDCSDGADQAEKIDQIRIYSGAKYRMEDEVPAGTICAVTGLSRTFPGEGLGAEPNSAEPLLEPVVTYQVLPDDGIDPSTALQKLRILEDEDPLLHVEWNEQLREIHLQLMGEVQMEIIQRQLLERFSLPVCFGPGSIVYRETIAAPVEGVGHFEPLRHYAEVHLLLEPGERGSGLQFDTICPEDVLDRSWQRLILTHLEERAHPGVLTGSPITDMKITLTAGRAHVKHTEGGDFRQATYRAVRQGLRSAESILLEPWYEFRLELPTEYTGRALSDLQRMDGTVSPPETMGGETLLTGSAPVSSLQGYAADVAAYTRGRGHLLCTPGGYAPCHNQAEATAASGYDPDRDTENPADSVFCSHGSGDIVRWDLVPGRAHVSSNLRLCKAEAGTSGTPEIVIRSGRQSGTFEQDKELQSIFERTYGPVKRRDGFRSPSPVPQNAGAVLSPESAGTSPVQTSGPEYLLVDGYNIIYAWDELKGVAQENLDAARQMLLDLLSNYQGLRKCEVIAVFDAYRVPHGTGEVSRYHNINVVYTREAETADAYIEKATYTLGSSHRVRVATSDNAEQLIILCHGALRVSADAFHEEMTHVMGQMAEILSRNNRKLRTQVVRTALEKAALKKEDPASSKTADDSLE